MTNHDKHMQPANAEEPEAFAKFKTLLRNLVNVPKKAIEAEEARWRANRAAKKKSGG